MFRNSIRATALTSEAAEDFFENIVSGNAYLGDYTFLSTLRGIVYPRMKDGESIRLYITSSNERKSVIDRYTMDNSECVCEFYPDSTEWKDSKITRIGLHVFDSVNEEDNDAWLGFVENKLIADRPSWERLPRVTDFFRKISGFKCICVCDQEHHNVMLYVKNLTMQRYHYMQCGILAYLPWYFNKEAGITPEEMEMIEGLRVKDSTNYLESCRKFATKLDLDTARIKKMLADIETRIDRETLENVKSSISRNRESIREWQAQISSLLSQIADLEVKYEGLQVKIASGKPSENSLLDFFIKNKNVIHLRTISGNAMYIQVTSYCDFFDEDLAEKTIANKNSFVYRRTSGYFSAEDIEKLMRAVFVDRTIRLRFCAEYLIDLNRQVRARNGVSFDESFRDTYMPNPHINQYSCLGNYARIMTDYMERGDNIGAIMQCIASCGSLNFGDYTVMEFFMDSIAGRRDVNTRAFELPDGSVVKPEDAIKWLNENEAKEE